MTSSRIGSKVLLSAATLLLGLVFLEAVFRVLGLAPDVTRIEIDEPYGQFVSSENPVLRYVPKPGAGDINDYGIRDYDYPIEKGPGVFRIVVIGDSIGYGLCTEDEALAIDDVFPKVLERRLRQGSKAGSVEVINLSVSGYDTTQEVEFLVQKGLDLSPDLVVLAYCMNDALIASAELAAFEKQPGFRLGQQVSQQIFLKSHLARLFWQASVGQSSSGGQRAGRKKVNRAFDRLQTLSAERDFPVVVTIFPLFVREGSAWVKQQRIAPGDAARARGFGVLDLFSDFDPTVPANIVRYQGRCTHEHPNESGHALAAESIERYLAEQGLWPWAPAGGR